MEFVYGHVVLNVVWKLEAKAGGKRNFGTEIMYGNHLWISCTVWKLCKVLHNVYTVIAYVDILACSMLRICICLIVDHF